MIYQYINVCPVPREMLKTEAYGHGFQHLPRDPANVNAWTTMFDPYITVPSFFFFQKTIYIMRSLFCNLGRVLLFLKVILSCKYIFISL